MQSNFKFNAVTLTRYRSIIIQIIKMLHFKHESDIQYIPHGALVEYLRLGPHGGIGSLRRDRLEAGPRSPIRHAYKIDRRSDYSARRMFLRPDANWNAALVEFEGCQRTLLWSQCHHSVNWHATALLRHGSTQSLFGEPLGPNEVVLSDAYIRLDCLYKPYVDVRTRIADPIEFEDAARPVFDDDQWWCAIPLQDGWRVFADSTTQLVLAKLSLSIGY